MTFTKSIAVAAIGIALFGCSFQNKNEREADKITRAVIANDLAPVKGDIAPGVTIPRVKVADGRTNSALRANSSRSKRRRRPAVRPDDTAST